MGCYINPKDETKEEFLKREGRVINVNEAKITGDEYPVCLVVGGFFTAGAVGYCMSELAVLSDVTDRRPKIWYMVSKAKLVEVSDLEDYLRE